MARDLVELFVLTRVSTLIEEPALGRAFEIAPEGEILWEFYAPPGVELGGFWKLAPSEMTWLSKQFE